MRHVHLLVLCVCALVLCVAVLVGRRRGARDPPPLGFSWYNPASWWPVRVTADFIGDSFISLTEASGLKRPCEREAAKDVKVLKSQTSAPLADYGRRIGKLPGTEIDFAQPLYRPLLKRILLGQTYIAVDQTKKSPPFGTVVAANDAYELLSKDERTVMATGPQALEALALTRRCGTTAGLEKRWAQYGLSPRQPVLSLSRFVKVGIAMGTMYFLPTYAYQAAVAAESGALAAMAEGNLAFFGSQAGAVSAAVEAGMTSQQIAAVYGVSAGMGVAAAADAAAEKCFNNTTADCVSDLYKKAKNK